jgi:lysozyme family protein
MYTAQQWEAYIMTGNAEMLETLKQAKRKLTDRYLETGDEAEKREIEQELGNLERKIGKVVQQGLREAASSVAAESDALLAVLKSARTGPFDQYLEDIQRTVAEMRIQTEEAMAEETGEKRDLPKTENVHEEKPLPPPRPEGSAEGGSTPPPGAPEVPSPVKSTDFADLKAEYEAEWAACEVVAEKREVVSGFYLTRLREHRDKYQQVADRFQQMPWYFVGIIHAMETGFRFDLHLHNGDPLSARTVRVPRGRPASGDPPFSWKFSATDAMEYEGFDRIADWSVPHILYLFEKYNGFGYRHKGLRTPYLWSFSNLYDKGKYVADGVFDPDAVSKQCGAAVLLKQLLE